MTDRALRTGLTVGLLAPLIVAAILGTVSHEAAQDAAGHRRDSTITTIEWRQARADSAITDVRRQIDELHREDSVLTMKILRVVCYKTPHPACPSSAP